MKRMLCFIEGDVVLIEKNVYVVQLSSFESFVVMVPTMFPLHASFSITRRYLT